MDFIGTKIKSKKYVAINMILKYLMVIVFIDLISYKGERN